MSGPITGVERQYDRSRYANSFNEVQVDSGRVFGAAFHEAFLDNPAAASARMVDLSDAPPLVSGGPIFIGQQIERMANPRTPISEDDFNRSYAQLGLKWDDHMSVESATILASRKKRELRNADIMSRGRGGVVETVGKFGSALAASLLDPVNIGLSFIPVVGQGRWAAWAAKFGPTRTRLAVGAIEGATGAVLSEPITYAARTQEQADYTAMDSLYNVLLGTALGSGLHAVTGKISDIYLKRTKAAKAHMSATDIAAKQLADGKTVDVTPVHLASEAEIIGAKTSGVPEADSRTTLDISEMRAGIIPRHEVVKTGKRVEVIFPDEKGLFKTLRGAGKTEDEALRDLLSSYEIAFRSQEAAQAQVSRVEVLKRELQEAVDQRNLMREMQNNPALFEQKLREQGVPVDVLTGYRQRIDARQAERAQLSGKKMVKKLRLFDEETARMEAEYKELARMNVGTAPEDIRAQFRNEMQAAEKRIRDINRELDAEIVVKAQETLAKQQSVESHIEYEPDDFPADTELRNRELEGLEESSKKDLAELEEQIKHIEQEEPTVKEAKMLEAVDEEIKSAEAKANGLASAVNCLMGKI